MLEHEAIPTQGMCGLEEGFDSFGSRSRLCYRLWKGIDAEEPMISDIHPQEEVEDLHLVTPLEPSPCTVWIGGIVICEHGGGIDSILQHLIRQRAIRRVFVEVPGKRISWIMSVLSL